ncbi:MAG: hypothetical protein Q9190_004870 [Brigantiaea leucoxantha]
MPNAEAVCAWNGSLSYAGLLSLSEALARRLVRIGVGPGIYVPFACEKSLWAPVIMLGILEAGGAFVPLNPGEPVARLAEILTNVNAHVVITESKFEAVFRQLVKHVEIVPVEEDLVPVIDENRENGYHLSQLQTEEAKTSEKQTSGAKHVSDTSEVRTRSEPVTPSDPIFVLFTSGSTGKPKGIVQEHRAICTHAISHGEALGFHGARVLQFAAHTFDVAIMDVFTTLIFGGCICIPSEEDRRNNIIGVVNSMKVDLAILTPSFAGLIDPVEVPTLNTLAVGGEALPQDRILRWSPKVSLIQIYGPAEAGIVLTMKMEPGTAPETVGRPLVGCCCFLVDPNDSKSLVPIGAIGEMLIAGPTLARGYLNDPDKTSRSFIESPGWAEQLGLGSRRFYKTGDLLRYNTELFDGSYDFIGRKDTQIKLRGQRMELGEVEHHINNIPGIAFAMVTYMDRGCFAGELVAIVQLHSAKRESAKVRNARLYLASLQVLSAETVQSHLEKHIPTFMIPSLCLVIETMPFVPSLKIDRTRVVRWLASMEARPPELTTTRFPKLDAGEVTARDLSFEISRIMTNTRGTRATMLEERDINIHAAGIDSIQVISLSMFIQRNYNTKIPMDILLRPTTTIRDLSNFIDSYSKGGFANVSTKFDVQQECSKLSQHIDAKAPTTHFDEQGSIKNIFLSGATGFLGSFLLQQLMIIPNIHVFALVRCSSESEGFHKIKSTAEMNSSWHESHSSRIHIWPGDLIKLDLGLQSQALQQLRGDPDSSLPFIDAIIHNGARVHYSSDYSTLKPVNIDSTVELLKIAARNPKISSFTFVSGGIQPHLSCFDSPSLDLSHAGGYAQTKHVSETLVWECARHPSFQNKGMNIVKPGYIIGSGGNGITKESDFIWRLVAGCVDIGAYNAEEATHWVFMTSVDHVASRVIKSVFENTNSTGTPPSAHVEKVLDGLTFGELWELLRTEFGYRLEGMDGNRWMAKLTEQILETQEKNLLFPLLHVLERDGRCLGVREKPASGNRIPMDVVRSNIRYLINVGFLPAAGEVMASKQDRH